MFEHSAHHLTRNKAYRPPSHLRRRIMSRTEPAALPVRQWLLGALAALGICGLLLLLRLFIN